MLRVIPALLYRIEFRRVSGQFFELEPVRVMCLEVGRDRAMHIPPVPDQNDLPPDVPVHFDQEPGEILRLHVVRQELKVEGQSAESRSERDRSDPGDPIMPIPGLLDRRVAGQGPSAAADRLKHEPRFVEEREC